MKERTKVRRIRKSFRKLNKAILKNRRAKATTKYIINHPEINLFNYFPYKLKWFLFGLPKELIHESKQGGKNE